MQVNQNQNNAGTVYLAIIGQGGRGEWKNRPLMEWLVL